MATAVPDVHQQMGSRIPQTQRHFHLSNRQVGIGFALTIELLAAAALVAATSLYLVGSVPHARAGFTPAGTAT